MKKTITLIKLGGSVITNKEVPMLVRHDVLTRLVREIGKAQAETKQMYLIGHGSGSFAHVPAARYKTMAGFVNGESKIGMAITQDSAAALNRIVVREFIAEQLPAVSFYFSNSLVTDKGVADHWCGQVLDQYLQKGLLPVTCGDVIVDRATGCTIWSTDKIFSFLAAELPDQGYDISRIVHVTEVEGVLDKNSQLIEKITHADWADIKKQLFKTKGFDVTGGMHHKLEELLSVTNGSIQSVILSGMNKNNLYNCLVGKKYMGTLIH